MALNATYPQILTEGGDDRLILNKKGTNKYHCTPKPIVGSLFRGSCTCNIPTETAYQAAEAAFYSLRSGEISVGDIMEGVRSRIKSLYDLPAGTEVFLCPSGSDAEYMPLLIAKTLNKGRKIVNIVTCDSEVGSGTIDAAGGRYFSNVVPLPDWEEEDKDDIKLMGSPLEGLANGVECISIPARCRDNGDVVDSSDPIQEIVDRCSAEDAVPIVHCVLGSKTGIYEPFPSTNFGKMVATRDAFVVVDACQGRFCEEWLHEYLHKGAIVLITGSKFYRGPPFSGAVLVPGSIMERLIHTDVDMPAGLKRFITSHEIPTALSDWKAALSADENVGLALRWVAALEEMEPTLEIPAAVRDESMDLWRKFVVSELGKHQGVLEAFEVESCLSIVSIRLCKGSSYLSTAECKKVFEWMTQDLSDKLAEPCAAIKCYIGQPVSITKDETVVRVALGSDSLRSLIAEREKTLQEDKSIIAKLALVTANYDKLASL